MVQMDVDLIVDSISRGLGGKFALGITTRKFSWLRVFVGFLEDVCANGGTVPYGRPRLFLRNTQCRLIKEIRVLKPHKIVFWDGAPAGDRAREYEKFSNDSMSELAMKREVRISRA